jgi:ethanolamine transporter EutH
MTLNAMLLFLLMCFMILTSAEACAGFAFDSPFGPYGEGGQFAGQNLTFGSTGDIYQLDAFINAAGQNLNLNGWIPEKG